MDAILSDLFQQGQPQSGHTLVTVLFAFLLAFIVGQVIGWVYQKTHVGLSYSQSFTASMVVLPVLVAMMMLLMSDSITIAFGLLAVFAVVRFRNVLKDTRDTIYILWAIIEGMAVGTGHAGLAVLGVLAVSLIMIYLAWTSYGSRRQYDTIVSLFCVGDGGEGMASGVESVLARYSLATQQASLQETDPGRFDLSYRLTLRDPNRRSEMESALRNLDWVRQVSVFVHEDESEV